MEARAIASTKPATNRRAVIVGINKYADKAIPELSGACNDANDISQRLKDFGNFDVKPLVDEQATSVGIKKAVSDLLWQPDPCDLALFYFSGHGFVDGWNDGYIAPHDMIKEAPLVYGIRMEELKRTMLKSVNKTSVVMIFDCCYSGILTKGPVASVPFDQYFGNLQNEQGAEGKIILASSEEDKVSREYPHCIHVEGDNPHPHGAFTFHLIEGLDGPAADAAGIITLDGLLRHVDTCMKKEGKQKPKLFVADASLTEDIRIATSSQKFKEWIQSKLRTAERCCDQDDPTALIVSVGIIQEVLEKSPADQKALDLKNRISGTLIDYQESARDWFFENRIDITSKWPEMVVVFNEIDTLIDFLGFDKRLTELDKRKRTLLAAVCDVSLKRIDLENFGKTIKSYANPSAGTSYSLLR